jgi:hypothetical protein
MDSTLITAGMLYDPRSRGQVLIAILVDADDLNKSLTSVGSSLVEITDNLVDTVWGTSRPTRPANPAFPLSTEFSGTLTFIP